MFTVLVQVHFVSSFANKVTLPVSTLELTMFVVLIIVGNQARMSLESFGTLVAIPFSSVGMMRLEVSFRLNPENV